MDGEVDGTQATSEEQQRVAGDETADNKTPPS